MPVTNFGAEYTNCKQSAMRRNHDKESGWQMSFAA
jgi:hypothetical protein